MNLYAIKDNVAGQFYPPTASVNDNVVLRDVKNLVNKPGSLIASNPDDFTLYKVGEYDERTGIIKALQPDFVVNLVDLKDHVE